MVLLAADMLLTDRDSGQELEFNARKAVFLRGEALFSFAGEAWIRGIPSDEWLVRAMAPALGLMDAARRIARRAAADVPPGARFIGGLDSGPPGTPDGPSVPIVAPEAGLRGCAAARGACGQSRGHCGTSGPVDNCAPDGAQPALIPR